MHQAAYDWLERNKVNNVRNVIDLGSAIHGEMQDARWLYPDAQYEGFDICAGSGVDTIHDIRLPLDINVTADLVICTEVFEHVLEVGLVLATAAHCLIPGGVFLSTCATSGRNPHSCIRPGPPLPDEHYENVKPADLELGLKWAGFKDIELEIDYEHHDLYARAVRA